MHFRQPFGMFASWLVHLFHNVENLSLVSQNNKQDGNNSDNTYTQTL